MNKTAFVLFGHFFGFIEKILPQCGSESVDGHLLPAIPTRCYARIMVVAIACVALSVPVFALTIPATWNSPTDVPVSAANYAASGNSLQLSLNCIPATGELLVIRNTGPAFIEGTFSNLSQGQAVDLLFDGTTYRFIANYYGGSGNDLVLVWAGARAFAWGYNRFGQLGDNSTTQRNAPAAVSATGSNVLSGKTVVSAAAGSGHSLAICSDGMVAAWGFNYDGELGNGGTSQSKFPVAVDMTSEVSSLSGKSVISVAAGASHSVALCSDGSVSAWGYNFNGELGDGTDMDSWVPVAVDATPGVSALAGKSVTAIAAGEAHTLALCSDGTIAAWGWNGEGQLGDYSSANSEVPAPVSRASGSAFEGKTAVAIAAGIGHSLALCSDGTVLAWGDNTYGQLGTNTTVGSNIPVAVNMASGVSALHGKNVVAIAAGGYHSLATCSDGTLVAWGANWYGELGDETTTHRPCPVVVNSTLAGSSLLGRTVVGIAAGEYHSLAKCSDGTIATWGWNGSGQLGDGSSAQRLIPVPVSTTAMGTEERFAMVVSGSTSGHTMALVAASPQPFPVVAVEAQGDSPLSNGVGSTDFGSSLTENPVSRNFFIHNIGTTVLTGLLITQSGEHTSDYVLTSQPSTTLAPGRSTTFSVRFTPHAGGSRTAALHIASNDPQNPTFTVNLTGSGTVTGSLAAVFNTPSEVPVTTPYYTAAGQSVDFTLNCVPACAELMVVRNTGPDVIHGRFSNLMQGQRVRLTYEGEHYDFVANYYGGNGNDLVLVWAATQAYTWGSNGTGQYGNGTTVGSKVPVTALATENSVLFRKTIVKIATGSGHTMVLCSDGTLAAWGENTFGKIGDGTTTQRLLPVPVNTSSESALLGKTVVNIAAGTDFSLALCSDGTVAAWGRNQYGQLGDGTTADRNLPVVVSMGAGSALNGKTVVNVAAGDGHCLAQCSDGSVVTWGYNLRGQLGDGTTVSRSLPVFVNASTGISFLYGKVVVGVSVGTEYSLALCADGTIAAWGNNSYGYLGDNTNTNRLTPVGVSAALGVSALYGKTVTAIASGSAHSLALCSDGAVVAWGGGAYGKLGDNTLTNRPAPVLVSASEGVSPLYGKTVASIFAGWNHSMALCTDGTMVAWGNNSNNEIGDNTMTDRPAPVVVSRVNFSAGEIFAGLQIPNASRRGSTALVSYQRLPEVSALPATGIDTTGSVATLNGSVNAEGYYNAVTTFDYGVSMNYGTSVAATPSLVTGNTAVNVSASISGLIPGVTYHYRVNSGGVLGPDMTFVPWPNTDASLSDLAVSKGMIFPAFSGDVFNYSVDETYSTDSISVLPVVANQLSSVTVNGIPVAPGIHGSQIPLDEGANQIVIVVTARDGTTTRTYTITANRGVIPERLPVVWNTITDIPVTDDRYDATEQAIDLTLNCEPLAGELMVIKNTGVDFIHGNFTNLIQGQQVTLSFNGVPYQFVANYYGGSGNDLVLGWAATRVFGWGEGRGGQLGTGLPYSKSTPSPILSTGDVPLIGRTVVALAAGNGHTMILCADGTLVACGTNTYGQVGDATITDRLAPVLVDSQPGSALQGKSVAAISAGREFCLALCSDGTVAAWGRNQYGQLGDNSTISRNVPVAVNAELGSALYGKKVTAVAAGDAYCLALCSDGGIAAWGYNYKGQLGDGTITNRLIPVSVSGVNGVSALFGKIAVAVRASESHSIALCSDGTVASWGNNGGGRLGDNSTIQRLVPVMVNTQSGVSALYGKFVSDISVGSRCNLALCSDGTLVGWGVNYGELGDNTTIDRWAPVEINRSSGVSSLYGKTVTSVSAGWYHSMALCADGTVSNWGNNTFYQLGDGTMTARNAPYSPTVSGLAAEERFTRLVTSNCGSGSTMAIVSSSIIPPAPYCAVSSFSNLSLTSAQLHGTVNPHGYDTMIAFEYGQDGVNFPGLVSVEGLLNKNVDTAVSVLVSGLTKGTKYYYRLRAASKGGVTYSNVDSFITRTEPSCEVAGVSSQGTTSAVVSGSVNAHGSDTEVFVDYGTDAANLTHSIRAAPSVVIGYEPTPVSVVLQNLLQSTTYYYRFRGQSVAGTGASISDSFQMATLSGVARVFPGPPPDADGYVFVSLFPTGLTCGWRFVGEQQWRVPGIPVGGLATGDYDIEFKPLAGYIQPPRETISVFSGQAATLAERIYYESVEAGSGGLTVILKPDDLADPGVPVGQRVQWRLLGEDETQWRDSGDQIVSLLPGNYLVECRPVVGRATPSPASIEVVSDQNALLTVTYRLADPPVGVFPSLVPFETVSLDSSKPYGFVGQIRSNVGSSSGFLIKPRVVATAGHVVFDDGTLSAVTGLQWLFQRHRGTHEPAPKTPRGFYVFDGYAAQRSAENTPGSSSPQSQHLDAAAIYFLEDVGRGGASGYLASDLDDNEFLLSASDKVLAGYPVDGIPSSNQGRMHATSPMNALFARGYGRTFTSSDIRGAGGMSGGPLCVLHDNGSYYPTAIYLGGSGQSVVRAIDSGVIDLFNRAEISGNGGDNQTGGGITHTSVSSIGTTSAPGVLKVTIQPASARNAGAGWKLNPESYYRLSGAQKSGLSAGTYMLQLKSVEGFEAPESQPISINGGQLKEVTFTYAAENDPPNISAIANRSIDEDDSTGLIGFTIADPDDSLASLELSGSTSNALLVPESNIVLGGTAANRTVLVTPASNQSGSAVITISVSDGSLSVTERFTLTVNPINDAPTITGIADQSIAANSVTDSLLFTIDDVETPAASLTLGKTSSNPSLVPPANIVLGGSGSNRTVTVMPFTGQLGTSNISVTVSDGALTATHSFLLTVTGTALETWRFSKFGTSDNTGASNDSADPDGDGQTNLEEYAAGTDPNNGSDVFRVLSATKNALGFVVTASGKTGRSYELQRSEALDSGSWRKVGESIALSADVMVSLSDTSPPAGKAFYRVVVRMP